jgi:hypothetical protein
VPDHKTHQVGVGFKAQFDQHHHGRHRLSLRHIDGYPNSMIWIRPERTRREELIPLETV